jgi:hypothetical protein
LKTLSRANVIWLLLPLQVDKDGKYLGVSKKDKVLADGYLQDAFERRSSSSPVAFGILLTKADVLDDLESEKAKQELRKLHGELKSHFDWLISCDFISAAALFPVSTLGFGNANIFEDKNSTTPDSNDQLASYVLRGNDLKPYNVDKLLMWSLACATQQPPIQDSIDATTEQNILNNYLRLDGLVYSLKDAS